MHGLRSPLCGGSGDFTSVSVHPARQLGSVVTSLPRDGGTGVHTLQTGTRGVKEATRFARDAIAGVPVRFVFSVVRVQRLDPLP